jgi:hypothetical protein
MMPADDGDAQEPLGGLPEGEDAKPAPEQAGDEGEHRESTNQPPARRIRPVDPKHLGNFRWIEGVPGQALAAILRGDPVGSDRMDVGPAGKFLIVIDHLTRLLAARFAGDVPKSTGTISRPDGVGRLQLAAAQGNASITLYFAVDQPTQMTLEGGSSLYQAPMGKAVLELVKMVELSENDDALIERSVELGDRIADRYQELMDLLTKEQLEVQWQPFDKEGTILTAKGAAEVKAVLDREVAEDVEIRQIKGILYEANARTNGFELEPADGDRIEGSYSDDLTDYIRAAWNRPVTASIRTVQHRRARSVSPFKIEHHLTDVVPEE